MINQTRNSILEIVSENSSITEFTSMKNSTGDKDSDYNKVK